MSTAFDVVALDRVDDDAVRAFFSRIPEGDRAFFRDDVLAPATLAAWRSDTRSRRLLSVGRDEVKGLVSVVPGVGWMAHVGELRVVVDPGSRRQGLGRALARQGLLQALDLGLGKVVVEVAADDAPSLGMFAGLGFEAEALLKGHIRDRQGSLHDLLILAHVVDANWAGMATTGVADALDG